MIKWYEGQTLLFNIKEDIGEATDLAGSMPEKVSELDRKLMAHLRATTDRIPIPNPTFASKP
jgi:hypothetical protein